MQNSPLTSDVLNVNNVAEIEIMLARDFPLLLLCNSYINISSS